MSEEKPWFTGSYDHTVKMFDTRMSESVMMVDHGHPVDDVIMFPHGSVFLTAGLFLFLTDDECYKLELATQFLVWQNTFQLVHIYFPLFFFFFLCGLFNLFNFKNIKYFYMIYCELF